MNDMVNDGISESRIVSLRRRVAATVRGSDGLAWLRPLLRRGGAPLQRAGEILTWLGTDDQPNLAGDRDIEWAWVVAKMPPRPGKALDFGNGGSYLSLVAAEKGYNVTAIDLTPVLWPYLHPKLRFLQGDLFELGFMPESFDLIINCSSIEHVGLSGRYGVKEDDLEGDIKAMALMRSLLKPGGVMLLTIPVGKDAVFQPLHRVYGNERLPRLLDGWQVDEKEFWVKQDDNRWVSVDETDALERDPKRDLYGLGLFVLRKGDERAEKRGG